MSRLADDPIILSDGSELVTLRRVLRVLVYCGDYWCAHMSRSMRPLAGRCPAV
jgi:hypothetical protein